MGVEKKFSEEVWNSALRFLAASSKSRKELFEKLMHKGFSEVDVVRVLDVLEEKKLIDDYEFASNLIHRYETVQPAGRHKIAIQLRKRGIPDKIRETLLDQLDAESERERMESLGMKRWERLAPMENMKRKKKVFDLLIRKGFDLDNARNFVDRLGME